MKYVIFLNVVDFHFPLALLSLRQIAGSESQYINHHYHDGNNYLGKHAFTEYFL